MTRSSTKTRLIHFCYITDKDLATMKAIECVKNVFIFLKDYLFLCKYNLKFLLHRENSLFLIIGEKFYKHVDSWIFNFKIMLVECLSFYLKIRYRARGVCCVKFVSKLFFFIVLGTKQGYTNKHL